jgi:hypothetical protein
VPEKFRLAFCLYNAVTGPPKPAARAEATRSAPREVDGKAEV